MCEQATWVCNPQQLGSRQVTCTKAFGQAMTDNVMRHLQAASRPFLFVLHQTAHAPPLPQDNITPDREVEAVSPYKGRDQKEKMEAGVRQAWLGKL